MKKKTLFVVTFLLVFVATYFIMCFAIPGMRIKLAAGPMEMLFKSISHMVFFKTMVSLGVALAFDAIFVLIKKGK